MNKNILYLIALLLAGATSANAQSGIDNVLQSVAVNNKTLQAGNQLNAAQKLEARTGNYLANPTIEFNQLWGDRNTGGNINELAVVQSFDFPSVYSNKNKMSRLKTAGYDYELSANRQQILLSAKQTCLEIIYLRKQEKLLEERQENAQRLEQLYRNKLEQGDANQLEMNKIQLELLNIQNMVRLNKATLKTKSEQLQTLNGGEAITFNDTDYPVMDQLPDLVQLQNDYLAADPTLKNLSNLTEVANREIKLSRAQSLPKFDVGYRRNGGSDETLNGFVVGLSIPLFENKNTVKKAKAQFEYSNALLEDNTQNTKSNLQQLYEQALALKLSCKEYARLLSSQRNVELLNKALDAGQISMIDYFVEVAIFYESQKSYLDVEKDYHNAVAQLLQYQL